MYELFRIILSDARIALSELAQITRWQSRPEPNNSSQKGSRQLWRDLGENPPTLGSDMSPQVSGGEEVINSLHATLREKKIVRRRRRKFFRKDESERPSFAAEEPRFITAASGREVGVKKWSRRRAEMKTRSEKSVSMRR